MPGNGSLSVDGYAIGPMADGLAPTEDGSRLVVVNHYNDSISIVDVRSRTVVGELDLRPGKSGGASGVAGGEYPFWVAVAGNHTAYVSSLRDREIVVVDIAGKSPRVKRRIPVRGNPNRLILDRSQKKLFVTSDAEDIVTLIDTGSNRVVGEIPTLAPHGMARRPGYHGASPNALALSPDERTLYVSDRGTNAIAVVALSGEIDGDDDDERDIPARTASARCGGPRSHRSMPPDQPHECSKHMIEPISQLGLERREIPERRRHLKAREHLAHRAERSVVARHAIAPSRVATFAKVQRRTAQRSPALPSEIRIAPFQLVDQRPERPNELQHDRVDAKHGEFLLELAHRARAFPSPPSARSSRPGCLAEPGTARRRAEPRAGPLWRAEHGEHAEHGPAWTTARTEVR